MLYSRITMYGADNRPAFEARLNVENKRYDIVGFKGGDKSKFKVLFRGARSKKVMELSRKIRSSGGTGTVFN